MNPLSTFDYFLIGFLVLWVGMLLVAIARWRRMPPPRLMWPWLRMIAFTGFFIGLNHRHDLPWLAPTMLANMVIATIPEAAVFWRGLTSR